MAHRRTFSARFPDMQHVSLDSPPLTPIPNLAAFSFPGAQRKARSYWIRMTFLALFSLIAVSVYVLFVSQPVLRPIAFLDHDPHGPDANSRWSPEAFRLAALRNRRPSPPGSPARPQISLNETQELAAVSSFIASLPQNMIPATVDPSQPIDPQLILDFDTRGPRAETELEAVMEDVWARNPVMLYSKVRPAVRAPVRAGALRRRVIADGGACVLRCTRLSRARSRAFSPISISAPHLRSSRSTKDVGFRSPCYPRAVLTPPYDSG